MSVAQFVESLRREFHQELNAKTGWGREELKLAFERAISNTLAKNTSACSL